MLLIGPDDGLIASWLRLGRVVPPRRQHCRDDALTPRAPLGWKQADLATASGVSEIAIKNIERGATDPRMSTVNSIQEAFDRAGVVFLDTGDIRDGGPGLPRGLYYCSMKWNKPTLISSNESIPPTISLFGL